jgi:CubicO group peptidase (beta-lactamase class C family)
VRRWIPEASTTGTVRQLLAHCAGCAAHVEFFRELREHPPDDPRAALVAMAAREPANMPGVAALYSDLGFIQLGAILERASDARLERAFETCVAVPLRLDARYSRPNEPVVHSVATELDYRGLVCGRVHDDNAYFGGDSCGHAGLFARIGDVATFASVMVGLANGVPHGRFAPDVVARFLSDIPLAGSSWRLGWDTPSSQPGVSQAGDRWPREHAVGHTGFTGTSIWLDLANRRWVVLLANRVHPSRGGDTADRMKALRRAVGDAALDELG